MRRIQARLFQILDTNDGTDRASRVWALFSIALILLNVGAIVIDSMRDIALRYQGALDAFEVLSVAVFTTEYLVRLWSAPQSAQYPGSIRGRIRFALTPLALVDLLAVLPFYAPMLNADLRFIRALRLFRLVRVFKLSRYSRSMRVIIEVIKGKKEELLVTLCGGLVVLVVASILMYYLEHEAQPAVFPNIPAAMWWGITTFTTVGYGDAIPVTPAGKVLGSLAAVIGIGLFALPAGILGSGFSEVLDRHRRGHNQFAACPRCGSPLPEKIENREPGDTASKRSSSVGHERRT